MAKDKLTDYDPVAANNTDCGGINLSEGVMVPSDLNNFAREIMSHLADFADGTTGVDVLTLQDDDASASIKLQAPSAVTTTTTFTLPDGDGTNGQVISTNGSGQLGWSSAFSSGMLVPYAGGSAPSGWLLCYGQAVSRTTYAALFSAIGTVYGSGDGSTTFNVPDLRGRVIAGQDDMGGSSANRLTNQSGGLNGDTLGATGGSETHTLTEDELAAHTHFLASSTTTSTRQTFDATTQLSQGFLAQNTNWEYYFSGASTEATLGLSSSTGSDTAHNNVQPTIVLNYIIKT